MRSDAVSLLAAAIVMLSSAASPAQQIEELPGGVRKPLPAEVDRWIDQLASDRFRDRQSAQHKLFGCGEQIVTRLEQVARTSKHPEQRFRAERIAYRIRSGVLRSAFRSMGQQPEEELDVEEAMWWISRIEDFDCRRAPITRELDSLAAQVRKRLGSAVPNQEAPAVVVDAICEVVFRDYDLQGAVVRYDHPHNSLIDRVLKNRRGLPILLSHVVVAVADRLDVPIVGTPIPGRYMAMYDGSRAPAGFPREDIIIDAFAGEVITLDELQQRAPGATGTSLVASTPHATVDRMLRNLASDYRVINQPDQAELVEGLLDLMARAAKLP